MGESTQHAMLVTEIVKWITTKHGEHNALSILVDSNTVPPDRRPRQIGGFTPDVTARTLPSSFVIIGEAKSFADFFVPHTAKQLTVFLEYLQYQECPTLVMATPLAATAAARSLVRRLQQKLGTRIPAVFLVA